MPSRAVDAINAHRDALLLREQAAMQTQARAWLGVEAELNRVAVPLIEQARAGNLTRNQIVQLERYRALMDQTSTQLKGYEGFMGEQVRDGQRTAASLAIDHAVGAINASAQEVGAMSVQFNRLPVAAVENMVGSTTTGSPLSSVLADASQGAPERLGQELINSIALGRNPVETARLAVRRGLGPTFTRMRTIARTEQLRVYREVSLATYSHSGVVDEYRRLSARDSRVCPACLFSDGRTYPISKPFAEHPQGRCTTVPVIRGYKAPAYETGEEWFKRQNVDTQKKILGNTRYDLWREGKVKNLGDFIEETHNDEWGDSMTTRSLYDVVGHRPVRPDRSPSIVDESRMDYFNASSGSGLPEMSPEAAEAWSKGTAIPDELWVVKASSGADKIRMNGFGGTVILDADPNAVAKKMSNNVDAQAVLVKVNVAKPAVVAINPMSSSKDIAEKFFGRPLADLQAETGETDVYKIFAAKGYDALDLRPPSGKGRMVIVFDPYDAVPVKAKKEGGGGGGGGGIRLGPKRWEPTMSRKDADEWAFSSAAGRDFYYVSGPYHKSGFDPIEGFSTKNGPFEHRFGNGVYLISDQDKTLAHFQDLAGPNQKTIVTRVKVTKIAVIEDEGWTMTDDEMLRLALKVKPKEAREMVKAHGSAEAALKARGYDAIEFKSTHLKSVGGNRLIVFNKENVVAIDGETGPHVPKAGKPKAPEPPPKPPTPPKPPPSPPKPPTTPIQAQEAALKAADKKKRLETPKTHLTAKYPTEEYGFYVDDEEISKAKTTSEIEKILEKRYPGTSFDFQGAHFEVAQTTADEFHRLAQKYPNVAGELKYVGTYGTKSKVPKMASGTFGDSKTIAHASRDGKYIGLNLQSYANPEKMIRDNKNSAWSGWTVQHESEVYPALTHEFGHHVENYYYNKATPRSVVTPYVTKSEWEVKKTYGNRSRGGTINHMLWEFNRWTKPTTELSKYAVTTNESVLGQNEEGWAEAFTKAELYPEEDWDPYTRAHRQFITVVKPDMSLYEKPSTEISTLPEKKQVEARGVIQDFYKKAGILFRG